MSTVQGGQGNIVTNGLVLNLDAANPRSYPQPYNGTTWQNIAPVSSSLTGSLVNGVAYTGSNNGALVFDGVNDYVTLGTQTLITTDFTIGCWFNVQGVSAKEHYLINVGYNSLSSFLVTLSTTTTFFSIQPYYRNLDGSATGYPITGTFNANIPSYISITRLGSLNTVYINGISRGTFSNGTVLASNLNFQLGWAIPRNKADAYFKGSIYTSQVYNRALNPSEVLQNFNATRARFGI
jgi:hypothetical protein